MIERKNRLMILFAIASIILSLIIYLIHRFTTISGHAGHFDTYGWLVNSSLLLPAGFALAALILYKQKKAHPLIPLWNTLALTFASISMTIGGEGMMMYHFSIFMVVAILSYYENIRLLAVMTGIFAAVHIISFLTPYLSMLYYGEADYSLFMLVWHAVFLVFTSGATSLQIKVKNAHTKELEKENEQKQQTLEQVIAKLEETSEAVVVTVKQLNEGAKESQQASHHITSAIEGIAAGNERQLQQSTQSAEMISDMAKGVHQIASGTTAVAESSSQTMKEANQGKQTVQQTMEQIHTIESSFLQLSHVIEKLDARSVEIGNIISVIKNVSDQTNLLALNAAIEAARAGEAGKGFAVVAGEVRKLASQTEQSTVNVSVLIEDIQQETKNTIHALKKGGEEVSKGIGLINQTDELFEKIVSATKEADAMIQDSSAVSRQLAVSSDTVSGFVHEMIAVTKEAAANSENITSSSEGQLASAESILSITQSLTELSEDLNCLVKSLQRP